MNRSASPGLFGSLRTLGDGLLGAVQDRLALLALEVEEEKLRWMRGFIWICAAAFAAIMTLICLSLALVLACGPARRLPVLGGLALLYGAMLAAAAWGARREWARSGRPLSATREEIARDRQCMARRN